MIHVFSFTIKYTTRYLLCLYRSVPAPDISTCLHSFKCFYLDSRDLNSAASLDTLDRNSLPEPGSKCPIKSLISKSIDNFQSNLNNRIFLYLFIKLQHKYEKLMTEQLAAVLNHLKGFSGPPSSVQLFRFLQAAIFFLFPVMALKKSLSQTVWTKIIIYL